MQVDVDTRETWNKIPKQDPKNFEKAKITKEKTERPDLVTTGSLNVDNNIIFKKREVAKSDNKVEELGAKIRDQCWQKSQVDRT